MTKDVIIEVRDVDYERLLFLKKNDEVFKDEDPGEIISGLIILRTAEIKKRMSE